MRVHLFQLIAVLAVVGVLAAAVWLVIIALRRERYTREKFAFAAFSGFLGMAVSVLSSLADRETPWAAMESLARAVLKLPPPPPEPPRVADHVLMVLVLCLAAVFVTRIYENWNGAISVRQRDKQRYYEPTPLLSEGFYEAKRIIKRGPPLKIYTRASESAYTLALRPSQETLAWHLQARDLICLRSPSYEIDRDYGWHSEARCWIGNNRRTSAIVAVRCEIEDLSDQQIKDFIRYVEQVVSSESAGVTEREFILAVQHSASLGSENISGYMLKRETEETLLNGLVNFSEYYAAIASRVERQTLTDSALTLSQVYTIPSCRDEDGVLHEDLDTYLRAWLQESGQRQLALLGDYGQGKSTAALMLVYNLIRRPLSGQKVPILIELRGKSPRHMTPDELLAVWALPYHIDPQSVMKLVMTGRAFLILEGFDEMALVGDSETRLSHFRTLWKFAYPGTKILITGRPNFFLDDNELRAALGIEKSAAAGPYCEALRLEPFTLSQINSALRSVPPKTRDEIIKLALQDAKFGEIVSRGSLLYVVSQLWEREKLSQYAGQINSAFVMDLFIKHSYRRQSQKVSHSPDFMLLNESERKYFTSGIAAYMAALDLPNQISREQFDRAVNALYEVIPETVSSRTEGFPEAAVRPLKQRLRDTEDPVQEVGNDVRSSGILVFDQSKSGALRFAHKSFMEFLIASVYGEHIGGRNREISAAIIAATHLEARHLLHQPESLTFLGEILLATLDQSPRPKSSTRSTAQLLFELMVVRPLGCGYFAKLRARLALRSLTSEAIARSYLLSERLSRRLMAPAMMFFWRPEFLPLFVPLAMLELGMFMRLKHPAFHPQFFHVFKGTSTLLFLVLISGAAASISVVSNVSRSAVRLWFICCCMINLDLAEMSSVAGRGVPEIARHLNINVKGTTLLRGGNAAC